MDINVTADIAGVTRHLNDLQSKQIPFAAHRSVNDTAFETRREIQRELPNHIDRPTPSTKRAIVVTKSPNKRYPVAHVHVQPWAEHYMGLIVHGGVERPRRVALVAPTRERRGVTDRYGNIRRGFVRSTKQRTVQRRGATGTRTDQKYFFGTPAGRAGRRSEGVWERYGRGGRRLRQVIRFQREPRRVRKILPFYEIGGTFAATRFPGHFVKRLDQALVTAR